MDKDTLARVRAARIEDVPAIARIEVETWRATYAGMLPDRVLLGMSVERQTGSWTGLVRYRPGDVVVAERVAEGGARALVGFGHCGPQRDPALPYAGEIYTLYVALEAQNQGVGRQLLVGLFARLADKERASALIWVIRANPSRFFYERQGGKLVLTRNIRVGGAPVDAVAYGWLDFTAAIGR